MIHTVIEFTDDAPTENLYNSSGHEYTVEFEQPCLVIVEKRWEQTMYVTNKRYIPWNRIHAVTTVGR